MTPEPDPSTEALEVSRRRWLRWLWVPSLFVALAMGLWWMGHPADLPTDDRRVSATTKTGQSVYLAVIGAQYDDTRRNLEIDHVDLPITSGDSNDVDVLAWICKSGSIAQTSDPSRFCREVIEAEGNPFYLGGGDQLMIEVTSESPGTVEIGPVRLAFREGLQRGTLPVGSTYAVEVRD